MKGDKDMDYRIVERKEYEVLGRVIKVSYKDGENLRRIPEFWGECYKDGTVEKLCAATGGKDLLGICMDMEFEKEQMSYMIAVEHNGSNTEGMGESLPGVAPGNRLRACGSP